MLWRRLKSLWLRYGSAVATALFAGMGGWFAYQLFCAWRYGTLMLFSRRDVVWVTRDSAPIGYFVSLGAYAVLMLVMALLAWLFVVGWRAEHRWFGRRATRPPIDDAIRERVDER